MPPSAKKILLIALVAGAGAVLPGYLLVNLARCHLPKRELVGKIDYAERVVVYKQTRPSLRVSFSGEDLQYILKAIADSEHDAGVYDTQVGLYRMEFYKGDVLLVEIGACGDLWSFRGKQYRAPPDSINKYFQMQQNR